MANIVPIYVDQSGPTPKVKRAGAADAIVGVAQVNPIGTMDGRDVSEDGTALDGHLAAAAPHAGHASTAAVATAQAAADAAQADVDAHAAASAPHTGHATSAEVAVAIALAAAAQDDVDTHVGAAAPHASHLAAVTNLASSGNEVAGELEVGLARDVTGQDLNLYSLAGRLGLEVERVGNSLRVGRRPRLWAPRERSAFENYATVRHRGRKTAGAVGDNAASGPDFLPAGLLRAHSSTDHLYPFAVYTGHDSEGVPHHFHAGLRGNYAETSAVRGYEFGHPVRRGDARLGHSFVWLLAGEFENVGWNDSFLHVVVELNPTTFDFAGPGRMDLYSPELGAFGAGARRWRGRVELRVEGPDSSSLHGEFTIFSSSKVVLRTWEREDFLSGGHDWLLEDQRLQLRWRVDRDLANRADVYTGEFQGERQGADLLRCHVDHYTYQPVGFRQE